MHLFFSQILSPGHPEFPKQSTNVLNIPILKDVSQEKLTKAFRGTTAESERIACEALRTLTSNGVVLDDTLGIHSAGCADARVDALVIVANLVARTTRVFYLKNDSTPLIYS